MKILKEMYGLIYGEMPSGAEQQELYREVERIKEPLRPSRAMPGERRKI